MSETLSGYKIGFIGLGNMGWPMACHLQDAAAEVTVWNRGEEPRQNAKARGMAVADSPAGVARWAGDEFICLNLTHSEVVADLLSGLVEELAEDAIVIDFGTTGYCETLGFGDLVGKRGAGWLDAPVSGGQLGAEQGDLTIMVGGADADFEKAKPVFDVVGEKVTHMGKTGAGQVTKFANQLIVAQTIDAVAQALRLAELAGLDSALVREALLGGFAESRILDLHGDRMVRRDFAPGGRSELQLKDVRLIRELAEKVGLQSPTLDNSLRQWERFVEEEGHGDVDHSGLFLLYEGRRGKMGEG